VYVEKISSAKGIGRSKLLKTRAPQYSEHGS